MTMCTEEDEAFWRMEERLKQKVYIDKMEHVRVHEIKCWPYFFQNILDGTKNFEIRYNDRPYLTGDILHIREYDKTGLPGEEYTGRQTYQKIMYISDYEQKPGYVVLALEKCNTFDEVSAALEGKDVVKPPKGLMDKLAEAAIGAKLPIGYNWGADAMESFNFGKHRAYLAVRDAFYAYYDQAISAERTKSHIDVVKKESK